VSELYESSLAPMPGAAALLSALPHPKCVASNGTLAKSMHALRVCGLARFFGNHVFSAYEVGHWKPEPHLFLHAARAMHHEPERCIVVEDSDAGLHAASAAGMAVIHFRPHSQPVAGAGLAVATISDLRELPEVLRTVSSIEKA